jgi:hypothetical protein
VLSRLQGREHHVAVAISRRGHVNEVNVAALHEAVVVRLVALPAQGVSGPADSVLVAATDGRMAGSGFTSK